MKLLHTSDLHVGKRVNEYSMIEDQKYILNVILEIVDDEKPDCVIIAGDVYDKSVPSAEAVVLFDGFISGLCARGVQVCLISGNHDSAERVSFGASLMKESGLWISPIYAGEITPLMLSDKYGEVAIYPVPFLKPVQVGRFSESQPESYTDAMCEVVKSLNLDPVRRNVMVAHQFVTGASRTESEEISVGGCDNVDASVFAEFDYTALGHIHRAQSCTNERIRYSGSPLKYSFSEVNDKKSVSIIELFEKGNVTVRERELIPLRDMKKIRGSYSELMARSFYEGTSYRQDYVHITLTDEEDVPDAVAKLRVVYENLMRLEYDNTRTRSSALVEELSPSERKSPEELFSDFYEAQNGRAPSEEQLEFLRELIGVIWEGEDEK